MKQAFKMIQKGKGNETHLVNDETSDQRCILRLHSHHGRHRPQQRWHAGLSRPGSGPQGFHSPGPLQKKTRHGNASQGLWTREVHHPHLLHCHHHPCSYGHIEWKGVDMGADMRTPSFQAKSTSLISFQFRSKKILRLMQNMKPHQTTDFMHC